jgi:hypothetical protein
MKKKISISVDQDVYDILARFCQVTGAKRSEYINEVVKGQIPYLLELLAAVSELNSGNHDSAEKSMDFIKSKLEKMSQKIVQDVSEL